MHGNPTDRPRFRGLRRWNVVVGLILANVFAVYMWLQYRRIGPWRDYLVGEKACIVLSLTAKALLAWQVFSAVLAGSST